MRSSCIRRRRRRMRWENDGREGWIDMSKGCGSGLEQGGGAIGLPVHFTGLNFETLPWSLAVRDSVEAEVWYIFDAAAAERSLQNIPELLNIGCYFVSVLQQANCPISASRSRAELLQTLVIRCGRTAVRERGSGFLNGS